MTTDTNLDVPSDRDLATLRRIGALPPAGRPVAVTTKALHAPSPAAGPVVAHLDPGQLRAPGRAATIYSYGPSRVDSYLQDFAMWGHGTSTPRLHVEFWDLAPGTEAVVSIRMLVSGDDHAVQIMATGNPVTMLVTDQATGGQVVTVNVPTIASSGWCTAVLEPVAANHGFVWFWADLRLL